MSKSALPAALLALLVSSFSLASTLHAELLFDLNQLIEQSKIVADFTPEGRVGGDRFALVPHPSNRLTFEAMGGDGGLAMMIPGGSPEAGDSILFKTRSHGRLLITLVVTAPARRGSLDLCLTTGGGGGPNFDQTAAQLRWSGKIAAYNGTQFMPLADYQVERREKWEICVYLDGEKGGTFDLSQDGQLRAAAVPWRNPSFDPSLLSRICFRNVNHHPEAKVAIHALTIEHQN